MKGNVIPRTATKLAVTFKISTSAHRPGDTVTIEKNDQGRWTGGGYAYFVGMLRNPDVCTLEVLGR